MTEQKNNETITISKNDLWKYSTFLLIIVVVVMGVFMFRDGGQPNGAVVLDDVAPTPTDAPTPSRVETVDLGNSPIKGDDDAEVIIVEFSDYECPFCARFYDQTLPSIDEQYIKTGKVKLVFKDFPLSFHPQATPAAQAARCAREQGGDEAYYDMHDMLFGDGVEGGDTSFKQYAEDIGLDADEFDACIEAKADTEDIQSDLQYGSSLGVRGTPGFLVGNEKDGYSLISGAQPFPVFQQAIEDAL